MLTYPEKTAETLYNYLKFSMFIYYYRVIWVNSICRNAEVEEGVVCLVMKSPLEREIACRWRYKYTCGSSASSPAFIRLVLLHAYCVMRIFKCMLTLGGGQRTGADGVMSFYIMYQPSAHTYRTISHNQILKL